MVTIIIPKHGSKNEVNLARLMAEHMQINVDRGDSSLPYEMVICHLLFCMQVVGSDFYMSTKTQARYAHQ